ncbi:MAG: TrbG/VirB9 family P-type conjugative transfer protein [Alphaproteobacteria bacterium]|nr:TrbG/VirB9 family P-type conjugative transfer protein [Alphaproteobacteria bacterium]
MIKMNKILSITILAVMFSSASMAQITKDNLDQNADQTQGNYAATNLNYLGGVGSLGMIQSAWKDPLQHMGEGQLKPGYSKYYWTPDLILPVRVREGMYTLINFPSWEVIENVYLGDGVSFTAQIQGPSSLMVYPDSSQFVGVDTNMIVFGRSGNKYVFYVQSETVNTDRITNAIIDIEVVNKKGTSGAPNVSKAGTGYLGGKNGGYSGDSNSADSTYTRDMQKEDWIERIPVDPTQFRFDIEVYVPNPDDIIIAPERVWRDNIFTYIDLGEKALTAVQRPIETLIVERSETPVGFRAAGPNNRLIIVEGMGDMVLRSGKRIVCLKLRRSDADGLENTIYAKTNEWDLQNAHASTPSMDENNSEMEDVYGKSSPEAKDTSKGSSFFDFSSFFSSSDKKEEQNTSKNQSSLNLDGYAPTEQRMTPANQNNLSQLNVGNVPLVAPNVPTFTTENSNKGIDINSIPKVSPVALSQNVKALTNANVARPNLEGQLDVNIGKSEIVVPEYNSPKVSTDTNNALMGNSSNNSSPILISSSNNSQANFSNAHTDDLLKEFRANKNFDNFQDTNISIELGTDQNVNNLEKLWSEISKRHSATIGSYQPFYSVDTPADGQGKEVFHLRVGPIKTLEDGDNICSQLGRNGIFCSVVRIQ